MTTQDQRAAFEAKIELPPLPSPFALWKDPTPTVSGLVREADCDVFEADQMQEYARVAIEHDRKKRGEPESEEVLWCLHILGPDDVHPAPSRAYAEVAADLHNARFGKISKASGVMCEAVVAPWPHSAESHAQEVGRFVKDWIAPQPTEPVAVLRFDRTTQGRENEMPTVVSCNRLPDGEYPVYTAPQPAEPVDKSKNLQGSPVDKSTKMQGQPAEPRLDAPAQVGHTRFGEGVPWSTVIGAAQRYHAAQNTPAKEQERIKKAAERIKALHQTEPVKVPSMEEIARAAFGKRLVDAPVNAPKFVDTIKPKPAQPATPVSESVDGLAHEIWSAAQLAPGEGIEDGVARILALLVGRRAQPDNCDEVNIAVFGE